MRPPPRRIPTLLAVAAGLAPGACAPFGPRAPAPIDEQYEEFAPNYPFTPVRVDIHPATRLGRDATGRAHIRVYVQFRDRWGDNVKTIGSFIIQLLTETEGREVAWDSVNLSDDRTNHEHYDPVTGMYEMDLYDLPDWAEQLVPSEERAAEEPVPAGGAGPVWLRIRFTLPGPDGDRQLHDDYYLRP